MPFSLPSGAPTMQRHRWQAQNSHVCARSVTYTAPKMAHTTYTLAANGSTPSTSLLRVCGDSTSRNSESLLNSTSTSYSACSSSSIHLPLSPSARQRPSPRCACPHECTPWRSTWRHIRARYSAEPAVSAGTVQLTCDPNLFARVCMGMPVQMSMHTGMTLLHLSACEQTHHAQAQTQTDTERHR